MLSTDSLERQLLDALPVTIHVLDLDGRLTSVHHAASRFGDEPTHQGSISAELMRGTPLWDVAGFARDQVQYAMQHLRAGRAPVLRWELARAADDRRVVLAQMTPLHDESRAVSGFVVSTTDVTSVARERELAIDASHALARGQDVDRAYQEAAFQLRQTLRPDLVVIAVMDDRTSTPRVVYESGSDADHAALEHRFATSWRSAIDDAQLITTHSGATVEITVPLLLGGESLGAITIVADDMDSPERLDEARRFLLELAKDTATAMERAQLVLHAAHKRRSEAIGEVAAGVSSELRNPIFGISSAAQLLRFRAREDPVMEKNVGRILREVERLNRMVGTLAELGRPVALDTSKLNPDVVWDTVLQAERGRLESRAIAVRRTQPASPVSIPVDRDHLAQAFRCILQNAVDAAPEASDLILHSVALPTGGWRCRLTNAGDPIAAEMLPRVFELFVSTRPGSPGAGLALARRIVEAHHGVIGIDSSTASGTTVTITLPAPHS